jgi:hypothetical protein
MGIRLLCPNGHKVHVKAFLAGKRGVCPECGARFDIPPQDAGAVGDGTGDEIATVPASADEAYAGANLGIAAASGKSFTAPKLKPADPTSDPRRPADPATLDLDALAAAGGTSLLGGLASGPGAQRLADRRKHAQRMRSITLALVVTATLLTCVVLYMVLRRAF